jgi:hypothetical protein
VLRLEKKLGKASLQDGLSIVSSLPDADTIDASFNGQLLVHVSGVAAAESQLTEPEFGVEEDALKFKRTVEMHQWTEERHKNDASHRKEWRHRGVDSSKFARDPHAHANPPFPRFRGYEKIADPITFGAFTLDSNVTSEINWCENIAAVDSVDNIPDPLSVTNLTVRVLIDQRGRLIGRGGQFAEVGDVRVTFQTIPCQTISIVGRQSDSGLSAHHTLLVKGGLVSAEDMFQNAREDKQDTSLC